jgi:hypothetical protein
LSSHGSGRLEQRVHLDVETLQQPGLRLLAGMPSTGQPEFAVIEMERLNGLCFGVEEPLFLHAVLLVEIQSGRWSRGLAANPRST